MPKVVIVSVTGVSLPHFDPPYLFAACERNRFTLEYAASDIKVAESDNEPTRT